ncbi:MAG: TetR/AcrR family transcriptional regulator [Ruminiclostridium sp.]|nr:TetR/AcrR family transcriptional regulator [Ruminiclostridium sp.]
MPPKAKITKEMIIEAGLKAVRSEGADSLNVRRVAAQLGCSTQPVMYHYKTVDELRADVYAAADGLHTEYIMTPDESIPNPLLSVGLKYIRFANEEKHLFVFLFQSGNFRSESFKELLESDGMDFMFQPLCEAAELTMQQAKEVFAMLFICVHGAASLLANNSLDYDEEYFTKLLDNTFTGAVGAVKRGNRYEKAV